MRDFLGWSGIVFDLGFMVLGFLFLEHEIASLIQGLAVNFSTGNALPEHYTLCSVDHGL